MNHWQSPRHVWALHDLDRGILLGGKRFAWVYDTKRSALETAKHFSHRDIKAIKVRVKYERI